MFPPHMIDVDVLLWCNSTKMAQLPHVTGQVMNVPGVVGGMSKDWARAATRLECPGAQGIIGFRACSELC